jgi:hypothetical protein
MSCLLVGHREQEEYRPRCSAAERGRARQSAAERGSCRGARCTQRQVANAVYGWATECRFKTVQVLVYVELKSTGRRAT